MEESGPVLDRVWVREALRIGGGAGGGEQVGVQGAFGVTRFLGRHQLGAGEEGAEEFVGEAEAAVLGVVEQEVAGGDP